MSSRGAAELELELGSSFSKQGGVIIQEAACWDEPRSFLSAQRGILD